MAKKKRPYGSGENIDLGGGERAIRWREVFYELDQRKTRKRYEYLGKISESKAESILKDRQGTVSTPQEAVTNISFRDHAEKWERDILATYKHSVQLGHGSILRLHVIPKFGDRPVGEITTAEIQAWISELRENGYAPHSLDHFHEVLNATMRIAKEWYGLTNNPAEGVHIGKIKCIRKKWALSPAQAAGLLHKLSAKARAMVALDLTTGLRRGELEASRWEDLDEATGTLRVKEASYRGHLDVPKTEAGVREVFVPVEVTVLIQEWKRKSKRTKPTDFIFATRNGKPENANNILRRHVHPACDALGIPRANWLTFRRTFSTWSHRHGVPAKDLAELMGHAEVSTQFIYVQSAEDNKRIAADKLGKDLGSIGQFIQTGNDLVN